MSARFTLSRRTLLAGLALAPVMANSACAPLAAPATASAKAPVTLALTGAGERQINVSHWMPAGHAAGTILFSHGALSAPHKYLRLIEPWVAAGWQVLAPLHVDSRDHPHTADYPGLASWATRLEDMRLLSQHIGATSFVAAGHSYGALVALTLGGAAAVPPEGMTAPLADPKVKAVVAFSPPAPIPVLVTEEGYAQVKVPALVETGTADIVPGITSEDAEGWRGHLVPFAVAAPGGHRYGLVLEGVDHYFGGAICEFDRAGPPQLERLDDAVRISSQFMAGFGLDRPAAIAALDSQLSNDLPVRLLRR